MIFRLLRSLLWPRVWCCFCGEACHTEPEKGLETCAVCLSELKAIRRAMEGEG